MHQRMRQLSIHIVPVVLGLFWLASAGEKLVKTSSLANSFAEYSLIPDSIAPCLVIVVGTSELLLGAAIILWGRRLRRPYYLMTLMLVAYSALGSYEYLTGNVHECGCGFFGLSSMSVGPSLVAKNLVLTVIAFGAVRSTA